MQLGINGEQVTTARSVYYSCMDLGYMHTRAKCHAIFFANLVQTCMFLGCRVDEALASYRAHAPSPPPPLHVIDKRYYQSKTLNCLNFANFKICLCKCKPLK